MTSYARRLRETGWLSMNATNSDLKRVQELYAVIQETKRRIKEFEIAKQEFWKTIPFGIA